MIRKNIICCLSLLFVVPLCSAEKIDFNGELEWSADIDENIEITNFNLFVTEEEELFVVSCHLEGRSNYPDTYYIEMYSVYKFTNSGDVIWRIDLEELNTSAIRDIFLTSMGIVMIGEMIISINNDGIICTSTYFTSLDDLASTFETYYNKTNHYYYQISDNKFVHMKKTQLLMYDYANITLEISYFNGSGNFLWPKNIKYSFKSPIVRTDYTRQRVSLLDKYTSDNGIAIIGPEYNQTESEYPMLLIKIDETGNSWINRYIFTSIDPLSVTLMKNVELNKDSEYGTNLSFPVIFCGLIIVELVRRKYL